MRWVFILEDKGPPDTADERRGRLLKALLRWLDFRSLMDPWPLPDDLSTREARERLVSNALQEIDRLRRELDERD